MAPNGWYTSTITSNTDNSTTAESFYRNSDSAWYDTALDICKEVSKPLHIHPWRQEPKRLRFAKRRAVKVSPAIFDRRPFLNAYKSARSMAT